jgi:hypothetical protein
MAGVDSAADSAASAAPPQETPPLPEAAPVVDEEPPLPLQPQVEAMIEGARQAYGPSVRIRVLRDAFVLAVVGSAALYDKAAAFLERTLTAYYNGRFQKPPAYAVLLYFFQRFDDYDSYLRRNFHLDGRKYFGV